MKLVSKSCEICKELILFQAEGTWCENCQTPFHKNCVISANEFCSTCNAEIKYPDDPLNLKNKKWHEGVANYPKEYWIIVCLPAGVFTLGIIILAWYFLPLESFGIFLVVMTIIATVFEFLFTPLLWKFDDWFLDKINKRKKANTLPKH